MKTEYTEALGREKAKPSKIKARYSRPTYNNWTAFMIIELDWTYHAHQFIFSFKFYFIFVYSVW